MVDLDGEDWEWQTMRFSNVCNSCQHLNGDGAARTCKAFPGGVPKEIWKGENDHTKPYAGDHGIQYKER